MQKANAQSLRVGRYSQPNQIYHLTLTCANRRPVFSDPYLAKHAVHSIKRLTQEATTIAFVIMPDHIHWLMQLNDRKKLSDTVRLLKVFITHKAGKIWQKGFYDHALRKEEDIKNIARYIILNPVRAGIVKTIREYPWWDCIYL
ncbi:REP-associated tyrosine transposase [Neptuniibacter marinus]|uniref:REP-associated tyrosine transposase n=1 Tax=Neptuniibacter marinus TaxID=1806670 RepID=UPI003B59D2E0